MAAPSQNVLVIGCGGIGERHVRCLLRTGRARVTACDADAGRRERIAATYGVPATGDAAAAIAANGPDAVVICPP
ncbi:MAG: Gfo/Idh/MocA family oxidoreductase, partial [Opitutaceae bacterium]